MSHIIYIILCYYITVGFNHVPASVSHIYFGKLASDSCPPNASVWVGCLIRLTTSHLLNLTFAVYWMEEVESIAQCCRPQLLPGVTGEHAALWPHHHSQICRDGSGLFCCMVPLPMVSLAHVITGDGSVFNYIHMYVS